MNMRIVTLLGLLLIVLPGALFAQDADLITDRPDFTESPVAVPQGSIQVELGGTAESSNSFTVYSLGETLVRYGFFESFELRLGAPSRISGDVDTDGWNDASIGLKWEIGTIADRWDVGLIGSVSLPTGDEDFSSDAVDPSFILAAGGQLTEKVSLGTQIQGWYGTVGDDRLFDWGGTVVLGLPLTAQLSAFAELAFIVPEEGSTQTVVHGGFALAVGRLGQIDLHGGVGVTDAAPDSFIGAGFSFRR
jgi:hypothetical protein